MYNLQQIIKRKTLHWCQINRYSLYIPPNKRTFWQPWTLYLSAVQVLICHSVFDLLPIFTKGKKTQQMNSFKAFRRQ